MHRVAFPRRLAGAAAVASAALVVALVATAPATATFPGRNGLIAFASDRAPLLDHPQIFSLSARGGQPQNLSRSPTNDQDAAPSPDGRLIAFARAGANDGIWLMNADGSGQRLLASGGEHPVWSPDGRTIAFNGSGPGDCPPPGLRCGHTVAVWAVRVDGSALRRLGAASRNASWAPDGRRVSLEGGIDPYGDANGILVMNADGTKSRWIASAGAHPAWSPNGRLIAYDGPRAITVVRPDGTGRRRLAVGRFPIWAPRGNRLAYLCGRRTGPQTSALCLIGADGRGRRMIARGVLVGGSRSNNAEAAWSPRGLRLAYARPDGIFVVNADGRGRRRVARKERALSISSLAWSGDGRRLLFTETRDHNDLEIYTTGNGGSNTKPLTSNAVDDLQPSWAPDGARLAFIRMQGPSPDIWVMDADGSEQRLVTRNGFDPAWTPDGSRIVFSRYVAPTVEPYSTYAVTVSSGEEQTLVPGGYHGAPSPDGARLAFLRGTLGELAIASADGSGAMSLAPADTTDSLSWSPDGRTIAFRGSHGTPYTIRVDGSGLTPIPLDEPSAHSYAFSPDGTAFTFSSGTGYPTSRIEVSGIDGSARKVVSAARGRNQDPDWQPLPR
jgi:Tol biopolymer transport system component